jgi:AraC-like DNA-binding protein
MWEANTLVCPRLLFAYESTGRAGYAGSACNSEWVLDYSFTPFGRCRVGSTRSRWRPRGQREAHLYPPRTRYWEDTTDAGVAYTRGIFVSFARVEGTPLPTLPGRAGVARFLDPSGRLGGRLERLVEIALDRGEAGFWDAQSTFCDVIDLLGQCRPTQADHFTIAPQGSAPMTPGFLQATRAFMQEHLAEPITRRDMARQLHMSTSAFAHRYRDQAGEPPMATLTRMRIQVAKSLLMKGQRLKTIAVHTGFCDPYHLSKTFKRVEGVSPRNWLAMQARAHAGRDLGP